MSQTWDDEERPEKLRIGPAGWARVAVRGSVMGTVVFGGLGLLLLTRLVERPVFKMRRPVTPWITQGVCKLSLRIMRLPVHVRGQQMTDHGAIVANHSSWLDIFVLNSLKNIYFVSKSEVAGWPGIGWLARATGTVFIRRDRREAKAQTALFAERLHHGHKLLFFPEGTSTDGLQVLPFKPTLFAAFLTSDLREHLFIQPVTLRYHAPDGADPRFYGWWGDMEFAPHLLSTLAARKQGAVTVVYHPPVKVSDYPDRKVLARTLEETVRSGLAADHAIE